MADIDINKAIRDQAQNDPEVLEHLNEMGEWNEDMGRRQAEKEGLSLTDEHWAVVHYLREHYARHGRAENGRELGDTLEKHFEDRGGRKWLYSLFPKGPVSQGSRIGGLPLPRYSEDEGFGFAQ